MIVQGWASTSDIDHALDMVMPGAFNQSISERGLSGPRGIKFLAQHDREKPIGRIHVLEQRAGGLWIEADIDESISYAADLANAIKANDGLSYSIGYRIPAGGMEFVDDGLDSHFKLHRVDLHEVSAVTFPCNEACGLLLPKSAEELLSDGIAALKALSQPPADPLESLSQSIARLRATMS